MMRNMAVTAAVKCWVFGVGFFVVLVAGVAAEGQRKTQLEVVTKYGHLKGTSVSVEGIDQPVNAFLGIPFAKPPIGALRFSPPQPAEPWSGVRDSTSHPPMCLQDMEWVNNFLELLNINIPNMNISEDCLYLNVYTPDTKAKLPVFVWIHGGGLVMGSASPYDGAALSAYGNVVVVVIQYRLGLLGLFGTGTEDARGNWGLLDQVAALQWVQENIEHFGGDPNSVTIAGESAGGFSVGALILSPLAKGLFHRAISESGVASLRSLIADNAEVLAKKVANTSGCESSSSALVRCLKSQSEEEIRALNDKIIQEMILYPAIIDGEFFPKSVEELLAAKEFNTVPYLLGVNNHEFGWAAPVVLKFPDLTEGIDRQAITEAFQPFGAQLKFPPEVIQSVLNEYLGDTEDLIQLRNKFQDLMGDVMIVIPSIHDARSHRDSGAPVYFYEFQHRSSTIKETKPDFVKADHGDEIFYVFGGPFLNSFTSTLGEFTEEEKQLSRVIMMYWTNFARNGNPNGKGLVEWPRYEQNEEYLEINLEQRKAEKPRKEADFWLKTVPEKIKQLQEATETHMEL